MSWFVPLGVRTPQVGNHWASVKVVMLSVQLHVFGIWVYDYFQACEPVVTAACLYHLLQYVAPQGFSHLYPAFSCDASMVHFHCIKKAPNSEVVSICSELRSCF